MENRIKIKVLGKDRLTIYNTLKVKVECEKKFEMTKFKSAKVSKKSAKI